jgi:TATA-box binding protein (TBP) (component of TFIID and TFIIIB)
MTKGTLGSKIFIAFIWPKIVITHFHKQKLILKKCKNKDSLNESIKYFEEALDNLKDEIKNNSNKPLP